MTRMATLPFHPYRREQQLAWRNRIDRWREHGSETAFHGLAILFALGFVMFLAIGAWPRLLTALATGLSRWPLAVSCAAMFAMCVHHASLAQSRRQLWARHWLNPQPIEPRLRTWTIRRGMIGVAMVHALIGIVVMAKLSRGPASMMIWCLLTVAAAWIGNHIGKSAVVPAAQREQVLRNAGPGSFTRWQWIEATATLAPFRLKRALWLILLGPAGHWTGMIVVLVLVACFVLLTAWSRSVSVLAQAERWLGTQPLAPARLLRDGLPGPVVILMLACGFLFFVFAATASLSWFVPLSIALVAAGALHYACAAAERRRPARIGWLYAGQLLLLAGVMQSVPFLLLPLFCLQIFLLLRGALRR